MSIKKIFAGSLAALTIFSFAGASLLSPAPAKAATIDELQVQIAALLAQIAALQGTSTGTCSYLFTTDLTIGSTGENVRQLQMFLNKKGFTVAVSGAGSAGLESTYFGGLTQSALAKYQASAGISPAVGYFGPITRAKVNSECTTSTGGGNTGGGNGNGSSTNSGTTLNGGAGSVDDYTLVSGLNNEKVGEKERDAKVAGLEVEVSDGSDIRLTALRLVFDEVTADRRFDRYAEDVSVMLDGKEIARVDADEFTKSNNWTKTLALKDSAIIRRDGKGILTVSVSGIRNLDSADEGETWNVDFRQLRYVDAQGASISEDPGTAPRTFSFESFANAANADMRVSLNDADDAVNKAHVIEIDDNGDTDDAKVLSFQIQARGGSDIAIDEIPVVLTANGFNLNDGLKGASLWMDGRKVGSENVAIASSTGILTFDDLDIEIDAGDTANFVVTLDIRRTSGTTVDNGDTVQAEIGTAQVDAIDAEDESGSNLDTGARSGSALGDAHALYDSGIMVSFVSANASNVSIDGPDNDYGSFRIVVDIKAFGGVAFVDKSFAATSSTSTSAIGDNRALVSETDGSPTAGTTTFSMASVGSNTGITETATSYRIAEGRTGRFEITMNAVNPDASVRGILYGIEWGTADGASLGNVYIFNMGVDGDYKTGYVFVND